MGPLKLDGLAPLVTNRRRAKSTNKQYSLLCETPIYSSVTLEPMMQIQKNSKSLKNLINPKKIEIKPKNP